MKFVLLMLALTAWMVAGCADREAHAPAADHSTDQWLGRWDGPEGTFLHLEGGKGTYVITIQDLDGPKTFQGKAAGDHIEFERNGVKESIRATNGAETGMKWLSEKSDCLTIRTGEGFCR
jgi:hypothetical protein